MTFRFQAKYALLTYAQCGDLCGQLVNDHLGDLGAECIVAREDHADGGRHLHVLAMWERVFRSRRSDVFDVGGRHPNIVGNIRDPGAAYDYVIKDGDVIAGALERPGGDGVVSSRDAWDYIISSNTEDEFWGCIRELAPKELCVNYPALRKYADYRYAAVDVPYQSDIGLEFTSGAISDLVEWKRTNLDSTDGKCWPSSPDVGGTVRNKLLPPHDPPWLHISLSSLEVSS